MKKLKGLHRKQQRFIKLFSASLGDRKPKSIYTMLLESGYSKTTAKQQSMILNTQGVKQAMKPILKTLKEKRDMALEGITQDKIDNSSARDNASITDILIKNSQLLQGKSTDNIRIDIDDKQYSAILKREQQRLADKDLIE